MIKFSQNNYWSRREQQLSITSDQFPPMLPNLPLLSLQVLIPPFPVQVIVLKVYISQAGRVEAASN